MRSSGKTLGLHKLDLKAVFDEFDSSGDGYLSMEEMATAILSLGVKLTAKSMVALFHHFDPNDSGSVHYGEFLWAFFNRRLLARQWKRSLARFTSKEIRAKFNQADVSGDGRLNKREFVQFLKAFGLSGHPTSEIDSLMYRFDVDGDGELDLAEFKQFMENEITVLNNADTLKGNGGGDISPILSQSRKAVRNEMHKGDPAAAKGKKSHHHSGHHLQGHPMSCPVGCAQYKLHKECAHMGYSAMGPSVGPEGLAPAVAAAAPESAGAAEDSSGAYDPEFITSALKAQARLESKVPGEIMRNKNRTQ